MIDIYWVLLLPFFVILLILEIFKTNGQPNPVSLLKRLFISTLLLITFTEVMGMISMLGDGITERINGINNLPKVLGNLWDNFNKNEVNFFKVKEALLFSIGILSYLIAYLGVFISHVIIHLCWSILYVCSPLMILMYLSEKTAFITSNLYKGLIKVVTWKIIWSLLGVILLELATRQNVSGWDDLFTTMLVNLCIGLSMLFVPFATKSLLSDGLSGLATSMSVAPAYAVMKTLKGVSKKGINRGKETVATNFTRGREKFSNQLNQTKEMRQPKNESLKKRDLPDNVIKVDFKNKRKDDE